MTIEPVAVYHCPMPQKFGLPRQAGLAPALRGEVRFLPPYDKQEALRGMEGFSHCWLLWGFSQNSGSGGRLTVRPPRLGGNERLGVFATRSPFRPNGIGLSCVRIEAVSAGVLTVSGGDLADGTPVFDVKPYVSYADSIPSAAGGFVDRVSWHELQVHVPDHIASLLPGEGLEALVQVLAQDPRPAFRRESGDGFGLVFGDYNIKFRVEGDELFVLSAEKY